VVLPLLRTCTSSNAIGIPLRYREDEFSKNATRRYSSECDQYTSTDSTSICIARYYACVLLKFYDTSSRNTTGMYWFEFYAYVLQYYMQFPSLSNTNNDCPKYYGGGILKWHDYVLRNDQCYIKKYFLNVRRTKYNGDVFGTWWRYVVGRLMIGAEIHA
jgi:hypothetical protein